MIIISSCLSGAFEKFFFFFKKKSPLLRLNWNFFLEQKKGMGKKFTVQHFFLWRDCEQFLSSWGQWNQKKESSYQRGIFFFSGQSHYTFLFRWGTHVKSKFGPPLQKASLFLLLWNARKLGLSIKIYWKQPKWSQFRKFQDSFKKK